MTDENIVVTVFALKHQLEVLLPCNLFLINASCHPDSPEVLYIGVEPGAFEF